MIYMKNTNFIQSCGLNNFCIFVLIMFDYSPNVRWIVLLTLLMNSLLIAAQQESGQNPFDLTYRMESPEIQKEKQAPDTAHRSERVDMNRVEPDTGTKVSTASSEELAVNDRSPVLEPAPEVEQVEDDSTTGSALPGIRQIIPVETRQGIEQSRTLLFVFFLIQLILLTIAVSLDRSEVNRLLRAMANDNYLNLVRRDLKGDFPLQYGLFYLIFISQLSLFLWLIFQIEFIDGRPLSFWMCILTVTLIYLFRHAGMKLIAYIFPVEREARQFNFTIAVFNMLLGLFLLPVNAFIGFAAPSVATLFVYLGLILVAGFYILRQLRGLFIASQYVMFHRFHFFLYLCTVEIAPVLIVLKIFLML